ncbi:2-keto-4-pentenoate hydratase [Peribacillus cavernae]|uniref:2-keto-4-pentenoate hydratase n=1 Tax=Peribacillus cavernae TaxID=1674310 RepID=A0A3S0WD14_9BACI|nr:fumarylacetoacetate hydrolase family protein [Peribacillus cavernae]MDQ0218021.1 2-keto-4-pentenoate hydratase [Peribacillus cavernae]RUQ32813.1 2-keto-4-pentenoate hydratase [Peribacillus cavernae]
MNIQEMAKRLLIAEKNKQTIDPLTDTFPGISVDDAYNIQLQQIQEKVANGAVIVGKKIGLTSNVMQNMFDVNEPDYGHLLDEMLYVDGETVPLDELIQPKLEFEIAFVLKKDLKGPGVTVLDVIEATDYIAPAFEVIDSRIKDWKICFEDTVADNGSSARAIIGGKPMRLEDVDLQHIGMVVYKNGEYLDSAAGAAVMGNPARAVAWLANALGKYDISLHAGEIVLSGALSAAVPIENGDTFTAEFAHIGTVSATFH